MKKYLLYRIGRPIIKVFMKTVYKIEVINSDNIPKNGRCILAGNHTNYFDAPLLISSTKRPIRFMAKKEIHKGIMKYILTSSGTIPVDRSKKDESAKSEAIKALKQDELICLFPEGTINRTDDIIMPFKYGAVSFADKTDSPIVPFIIKGEYKRFKKSVKIKFLRPYKLKTSNLEEENKILMNKVKKELEKNEKCLV